MHSDDVPWQRFLEAFDADRPHSGMLLTYRDVFGTPPFTGQLLDRIKSLDAESTLLMCAYWQADLAKFDFTELADHGQRAFLALADGYPRYEAQFVADRRAWSGKLTITPENLARLALALCLVDDDSRARAMPGNLAFFECILIFNDCLVHAAPDPIMRHFAAEFQTAATIMGNEETTAYRYIRFLDFARERFRSKETDVDVDDLYAVNRGETLETHYSVATYLLQWVNNVYQGAAGDEDPVISFDYSRLSDVRPARSYLHYYSWTRSELKHAFGTRPLEHVVQWWYSALLTRPLVQISKEKLFCPSPTQFRHALVSLPYFGVFNVARSIGDDVRLRVTQLFADFFESYVVDLMRLASMQNGSITFAEQSYHRGKQTIRSTDCAVWTGRELLLMECQAGFPTFDLLVDMNFDALANMIENMVVKKSSQLAKRIRDFRQGLWTLDGVPADVDIIPLVVHPHALPRSPLLNLSIERGLSKANVEGFEAFDILEVEGLESILTSMKHDKQLLPSLLGEKLSTASMRSQTFTEFLRANHPELIAGFKECTDRLLEWNDVVRSRVAEWNAV